MIFHVINVIQRSPLPSGCCLRNEVIPDRRVSKGGRVGAKLCQRPAIKVRPRVRPGVQTGSLGSTVVRNQFIASDASGACEFF
jgi:hypothetical protein